MLKVSPSEDIAASSKTLGLGVSILPTESNGYFDVSTSTRPVINFSRSRLEQPRQVTGPLETSERDISRSSPIARSSDMLGEDAPSSEASSKDSKLSPSITVTEVSKWESSSDSESSNPSTGFHFVGTISKFASKAVWDKKRRSSSSTDSPSRRLSVQRAPKSSAVSRESRDKHQETSTSTGSHTLPVSAQHTSLWGPASQSARNKHQRRSSEIDPLSLPGIVQSEAIKATVLQAEANAKPQTLLRPQPPRRKSILKSSSASQPLHVEHRRHSSSVDPFLLPGNPQHESGKATKFSANDYLELQNPFLAQVHPRKKSILKPNSIYDQRRRSSNPDVPRTLLNGVPIDSSDGAWSSESLDNSDFENPFRPQLQPRKKSILKSKATPQPLRSKHRRASSIVDPRSLSRSEQHRRTSSSVDPLALSLAVQRDAKEATTSLQDEVNPDSENLLRPQLKPRKKSVSFRTEETHCKGCTCMYGHPMPSMLAAESGADGDPITFATPIYGQDGRKTSTGTQDSELFDPSAPRPQRPSINPLRRASSANIVSTTSRRCSDVRNVSRSDSISSTWSYQSQIYQEEYKPRYDPESELVTVSKFMLRWQKYFLILFFLCTNAVPMYFTFSHYGNAWWVLLPILSINTFSLVAYAIMITASAVGSNLWRFVMRIKDKEPAEPERIVMLLPCYNEDRQEMTTSIQSLVDQVKIDHHPRIIMVVIDGNARAPGEDKSTQDFVLNEIFAGGESTVFENGYICRDGSQMRLTIQDGMYQGVPYVVVAKARNQGKRDSLCLVRSFLYHYKNRSEDIPTMFHTDLFDYLGSVLTDNGLSDVDYLTGMDGDTVFDKDCVYELVKSIRRHGPQTVGVCGAVLVKFEHPPQSIRQNLSFYYWTLLQNFEYMNTQGLRREFQSRVTGKVNCLPGCCQLIRVNEAAFGDEVLRTKFGYVPKPTDNMIQQIMGIYSEDSRHASIIFSLFPKSRTAQALQARAYTTVPQSWKVYLSQRKRWALGSVCNQALMVFSPNILWIERISSTIAIVTWWLGPFVYSSLFGFLIAIHHEGLGLLKNHLMIGLLSVIAVRYLYTIMIVVWMPNTWASRWRFLAGFLLSSGVSPMMNIAVTFYSLLNCDQISWGKTRMSADGETGHGGAAVSKPPANRATTVADANAILEKYDREARDALEAERLEYETEKMAHKGPVL